MIDTLVEIAVFAPLNKTFTYQWPEWLGEPQPGMRVHVPFGRGRRLGVVWRTTVSPSETPIELKAVIDRVDARPLYDSRRMQWLERACRYYVAAPGECAETAFAWAGNEDKRRWHCTDTAALSLSDDELAQAFAHRGTLSAATLRKKLPASGFYHRLRQAVEAGHLTEALNESALRTSLVITAEPVPERLLPAQQQALDRISHTPGFSPFLLFGCTGSGKTEVYLRAARQRVDSGSQVLILVPEIGLTPQWLARLATRFEHIAVWHSGLSDTQRLQVRRDLPDVEVLVGTRSALFLPLPRCSMIVVDEEHDTSFKQQEGMHYHARDLAILLAQEMDIPIILGTATPSLESWRHAREGRYQLLELPERIAPHPAPAIETVDMRGVEAALSEPLLAALRETKAKGLQSLLYLNRRGYAPALMCTACGDVPECPSCSFRLTLHRRKKQLRCHGCGFVRHVPVACEHCGEDALLPLGEGTEKVEEQLAATLPDLRMARLDRDAIRNETRLMRVLGDFSSGKLDCLVGTQMLVKGHHFPNVTLVGVVNADLGLGLPDFRAGERWWQQITQVVGRTGRGSHPGRIIVQTRNPEAEWLSRIGGEQARDTLDIELSLRKTLDYPPFARWVRIIFSSTRSDSAIQAAERVAQACTAYLPESIQCMGPMPCAIERIATRYRFELVLREITRKHLPWCLMPLLSRMAVPTAVRMRVDVDPVDMM
ncbi:MAG: primosomal protein N' [Zetaproteobacteria bacterium]|nr:MAG: primosomal protein N' [Zetaproteobacteria bacterium]